MTKNSKTLDQFCDLNSIIVEEIEIGTFPGVEILYAKRGEIILHHAWGNLEDDQPLNIGTMFDVASLTKPIATATLLLLLVEQDKLNLDALVKDYIPEYSGLHKDATTLRQLASHVSGLPATVKLYKKFDNEHAALKALLQQKPLFKPSTKMLYSCLGYLILGEVICRITHLTLADLFEDMIAKPLNMHNSMFLPFHKKYDVLDIAPTRKGQQRGIVHDGNAQFFNKKAGNAGLFSTAKDIYKFAQMIIAGGVVDGKKFLSPNSIANMVTNQNNLGLVPRTIGWETNLPDHQDCSCGDEFPNFSIGHTGFTGTSLWLNRQTQQIVVILSNRVRISHDENIYAMNQFRKNIHRIFAKNC